MSTKPETPPRSRAPSDLEIDAMRDCLKRIGRLPSAEAKLRVVDWLTERVREQVPKDGAEGGGS